AKIALTALAVLAFFGGSLAFKANRGVNIFYVYTTSIIFGKITGICDENSVRWAPYTTTAVLGWITTVSAAPATNVTTCTARITVSL
ncbi:hypothetical protein, partial [Chitinophaga sp.]|uniref:hypothetical protein n=1 Tax=Chitinophaga sp. TaxID=1869181 RepID=UPI002F93D54F